VSRAITILMILLVPLACNKPGSDVPGARATKYENGHWYTGDGFVAKSMYVESGRFVDIADQRVSKTVDLDGAFVVPAFAEGHHHMVLCDPERVQTFIEAGILYAGILNARVTSRECQARLHGAETVEVVNALAGITARSAHPSQIGRYFLEESEIDGEWVHYVDNAAELESVWHRVESTKPDLLKVFLSYSEDFEMLRDDPEIAAWYRGLDPALIAPIVERAHAAGIRVVAHAMSAYDFEVAVAAGVDMIGHMPGFAPGPAFTENESHPWLLDLLAQPNRYKITSEAARMAADKGVSIITTVAATDHPPAESIVHNFKLLRESGATLLIGSDQGEGTSIVEARYLVSHNLMTSAEVLKSLAVDTSRQLFPGRGIGELAVGSEATFVVLADNPVDRFGSVEDINMVVKRGQVLFPVDR
jgi:imidazolonepropionase-like amidohydrolase